VLFRSVANKLDVVSDAANRIGTTAEELMRLQYAARLSDSSAEAAASSLENLGRIAGEAALGVGRGAKVFSDLGLSAKDASGKLKPTTQLLAEVGDKIKDLPRGEQLAVLGKLGIDPTMIRTITGGMQSLRSEFDALYKAAGVDLNNAAEASSNFNDSLDRLRMTFDAVKTAIAIKFMPQIARGIDTVRQFLVQNLPKIIGAVQPIFSLILRIAEAFITLAARIGSGIATILGWFVKMNDATDGWAGYLLAAAAAWKFLNLSFLATPIGILLSLAAVVALLIDDFLTFREGGESLIDWGSGFGTLMLGVTGILGGLLAAIVAVKGGMMAWSAATAAFNTVMGIAKVAMAAFNLVMTMNPIGLVIVAIAGLIAAGALLIANWESVKAWFAGFFDWLLAGWEKMKSVGGAIAEFFGFGGSQNAAKATGANTGAPSLAPSPQAAAAVTNGNQNVNQQTQIVVQGAGSPDATARAVAGQQNRVNADMARNMRGAAR